MPAAFGGALVALVGAVALLRGVAPLASGSSDAGSAPIVVSGAYVRAPAPPTDAAAAYFTVYNAADEPDRLLAVRSNAGAITVLHTAGMTADMDGVVIPAHSKFVLSTGHGHVMIEKLVPTLRAGQTVKLSLVFENAGIVSITAKVIALGAQVPTVGESK